jgi:hypothetical protein
LRSAGFVESLARPGGNATGFTLFEFSTSGKWLELLKEIAPRMTRAAVLRDVTLPTGMGQFAAIQSAATPLGVELRPLGVRDASEIERGITGFAQSGPGGLIVTSGAFAFVHRELIVTLAARHRLPAVSPYRRMATGGGLMSYGPDASDAYRRAATYVDRILKGEKPADLPVQAPTKYELVINLKTAKALALLCRIACSPAPTRRAPCWNRGRAGIPRRQIDRGLAAASPVRSRNVLRIASAPCVSRKVGTVWVDISCGRASQRLADARRGAAARGCGSPRRHNSRECPAPVPDRLLPHRYR